MRIEILGPGCVKCARSAETARAFLAAHGLEGDVEKLTGIDAMLERGVLRTPAVYVDGVKVVEGRVLRASDLEPLLAGNEG